MKIKRRKRRFRLYIRWSLGILERLRSKIKLTFTFLIKTFLEENNNERSSKSHFLWIIKCGRSNSLYHLYSHTESQGLEREFALI